MFGILCCTFILYKYLQNVAVVVGAKNREELLNMIRMAREAGETGTLSLLL